MRRPLTQRTVTLAGWAILAVTLAVCVLGLHLTALQKRDMSGILLDVERQYAEAQRVDLERFLDERELAVLQEIAAADGPPQVAAVVRREPLVMEPFLVGRDGAMTFPLLGEEPRQSSLLDDEIPPVELERALQGTWSQAPLEEKLQALEEIHESEGVAPQWRLRALGILAALLVRSGEVKQAVERYRLLFEEFEPLLLETTRPSYLQLVLARADCLVKGGRDTEARSLVLDALEKIRRASVRSSFEEQRFFLERARRMLTGRDITGMGVLFEVERLLDERRLSVLGVSTLRNWVLARGLLDERPRQEERPQHFFEQDLLGAGDGLDSGQGTPPGASASPGSSAWTSGDAPKASAGPGSSASERGLDQALDGSGKPRDSPVIAVWLRRPAPQAGSGSILVGFRMDPARLESLLGDRLSMAPTEKRLVARVKRPRFEKEFLPLVLLSGDRVFLAIGLDRAAWDDLLSKAQTPLAFAGALIGILAGLLTLGLVVVFRSVRREMTLSRMKTEFVANVSHELKTPLALIRLFAETLLLDRVKDPEQRKRYHQTITRESERLGHLIGNVLNFASIEAGKKQYEIRPCQIEDVVRETYETYQFHLNDKGFTHRLEIHPGIPGVLADPDAVSQAVINLLENAIKYSPQRKEILVQVTGSDAAVSIAIDDRGVGISAEDQQRIWQGYYRTREARALGTRGSGLGLSLVRHIMAAHGGRVDLRSAPGEGSRFTLVFPSPKEGDGAASPQPVEGLKDGE